MFVLGMDGDLPTPLTNTPAIAATSVRLLAEDWAKHAASNQQPHATTSTSAASTKATGRLLTEGPAVYSGTFAVAESERRATGLMPDTYLTVHGWGKGIVWVNGHNLGWYWPLVRTTAHNDAFAVVVYLTPASQQEGPQLAMYVPGPFLRAGNNEVVLLELVQEPQGNTSVGWSDRMVWNSIDPPPPS